MKGSAKSMADMICTVTIFPLYLFYLVLRRLGDRDKSFWGFSQLLSLFPGVLGNYLRKNFYRLSMASCDRDCAILFGTIFSQIDTEIGKGVYIGPNCNIGKCRIEDYCTLGSNVHVMSGKHQHGFADLDIPIKEQGGVFEKVTIGEDTWIGNGALIMANVSRKCIVGAGSVITKDVEECSVVAGNPAKVIKKRT